MKKNKFLLALLAIVLCFTLVGCGDDAKDNTNTGNESNEQTNTGNNNEDNNVDDDENNNEDTNTSGGTTDSKVMKCTINNTSASYVITGEYSVYHNDETVSKVVSSEVVSSDDASIRSQFATTLKATYQSMKDNYGGYDFEVVEDGNKVVSTVTIDYSAVNLAALASADSSIAGLLNDNNQILVSQLKSYYALMGITCE